MRAVMKGGIWIFALIGMLALGSCRDSHQPQPTPKPDEMAKTAMKAWMSPPFRVKFVVSCEDPILKSSIETHVSNGLNSLPDVKLVEASPLFTISIIAVPLMGSEGQALSYTITTDNVQVDPADYSIKPTGAVFLSAHSIMTGHRSALKQQCDTIVTNLNISGLSRFR